MREVRFVLHPTSDWTPQRLDRLYRHLPAPPGRLRLEWVHPRGLPAAFYRTALSLQPEALGARQITVVNTMRADAASVDDALEALLADVDSGIEGLELSLREQHDAGPLFQRLKSLGRLTLSGAALLTTDDPQVLEALYRFLEGSGLRRWRLVFGDRLSSIEQLRALERLSDLCLAPGTGLHLEPVTRAIAFVRQHHNPKGPSGFFDRRAREDTFTVAEDGRIDGTGSLFDAPFAEIVQGPKHQRTIVLSEIAMQSVCGRCRFYGSCPGEAVAVACQTAEDADEAGCLVMRPLLEHIERRLGAVPHASADTGLICGRRPAGGLTGHTALRPGARVRVATPDAPLEDRLSVSSGTAPPAHGSSRYHVGALIPRPPWRAPTPTELALLRADASDPVFCHQRDVAIVRLPAEALAKLSSMCEACGGQAVSLEPPRWAAALCALEECVRPYLLEDHVIESVVLYRSEPGPQTLTRVDRGQPQREVHVGLHLDSWEGTSLRRRTQIRNRLCVNLSTGSRYFLFVNLSIAQMMRELGLPESDDLEPISLFSGHKFMHLFPDYPVIRLELRPLEAYIAPTGNLIHDGACGEQRVPDVALHALGYFGLPV